MIIDLQIYVEIPHTNDEDVDLFRFQHIQDATNYLINNEVESFTMASSDARNAMYQEDDYTDMSKQNN